MSKSTFAKTKAQIKSYQYYIFWGACTVAVMAGQIFVGAGYQSMSQSVQDLTEMIEIQIELEEIRKGRFSDRNMPIIQYFVVTGIDIFENLVLIPTSARQTSSKTNY